jgi:polysaccharide biosynthesis protein PslH
MGCLWLTLADPDPPVNGQFLYSGGLIRAVADAGLDLTVLGICQTGGNRSNRREGRVAWHITDDPKQSPLSRLLSPMPNVALRSRVPALQRILARCLGEGRWDAVVFDSICDGWALPAVLRHRRRFPATRLVYLAHNHETTAARQMAMTSRGLRRLVRRVDALKVARLERWLADSADLVTADSPDDRDRFAAGLPDKPVIFLPPGYGGKKLARRTLTAKLPRRAVVVGSFDWPAKRASLESFLAVAAPLFARARVELQIVGAADAGYLDGLRRLHPGVEFTGRVPEVEPYMAAARLALVPDQVGGFKLKSLDYVFNRLPIFGIDGAVPGMPMVDGEGIRLFASHEALARGVVAAIDDLPGLNAQQDKAYAACAARFDWAAIGRAFVDALHRAPMHVPVRVPVPAHAAARAERGARVHPMAHGAVGDR